MSLKEDNLAFSSAWEIEQLVATNSVNVGSGDSVIYTLPSGVTSPVFEVYFSPAGGPGWFLPGNNSLDGTVAGQFSFSAYLQGSQIHIKTDRSGSARYFVWQDRLDY